MANQGQIHYGIQLDTGQLKRDVEEVRRSFGKIGDAAENESRKIDDAFSKIDANVPKEMAASLRSLSDDVFGNLPKRAQELAKEIQEDILSLGQLEKMQNALNDAYEAGKVTLEEYLSAQAKMAVLHDEMSAAIQDNERALRESGATTELAEDSIAALRAQVALLTAEYMKLSQAQREGAEGETLLKNLSEVQSRLQGATVAMNQYAQASGAKFNGLNFQVQQLVRELPSLAMGPQMFFMAISNNLPMFTDEVARARKEYDSLVTHGREGTPVWKQIVSSLFSWQTALVGGIMLLITYGDEIVSWIGDLLKGKDALDAFDKSHANMISNMAQDIAQVDKLFNALRNATEGTNEYREAQQAVIDQYGEYLQGMVDEEGNLRSLEEAYNAVAKAVRNAAMEKGMEQARTDATKKMTEAWEDSAKDLYELFTNRFGEQEGARLLNQFAQGIASGVTELTPELEEIYKKFDDIRWGSYATGKTYSYHTNDLRSYTTELLEVNREIAQSMKIANAIFAQVEDGSTDADNATKSLIDSFEKERRNAELMSEATERDIEIKNKRLKQIDDEIARLRNLGIERKNTQETPVSTTDKEYKSALKEYNDFTLKNQEQLRKELEELERAGITDRIELIEYERRKTLEAIDAEEAAYRKLAETYNALAASQNKPLIQPDTSSFELRRQLANRKADNNVSNELAASMQQELDSMNEYLAEYGTYQEKRLAIAMRYADQIAEAEGDNYRQETLKRERERALQELDLAMAQKTDLWTRLFTNADALASDSIRQIISDTEMLLQYIESIRGGADGDASILKYLGLTKDQVEAIASDPSKIKDILDELKEKRDALNTRNPFRGLIQGFKDLKDAAGDADKQMEALNKILEAASAASQLVGDLGNSMSELGEAIGSDFVSGFGAAMSEVSSVANSALSGMQAGMMLGGPVGAGIGAGIGAITGLISGIGKRIAYNKQVRQEYLAQIQKEYLAEFEINALYRERYEWAQKIGETTLLYLNRNSRELDRQIKANAEEQDELWAKLMGAEYVSGEKYHHGTWFKKARVEKFYSELAGQSWEDIELLAAQGKLTDEAQEYYEALKAAKEEGVDLQEQLEQLAEETREAFTGIGYDSLVDSIVDGFREGKRSAEDFAGDFEEMMQDAVLQSLKMQALEAPLRRWYENFATVAEDGLSQEEIESLRAGFGNVITGASNMLEQLEAITGMKLDEVLTDTQTASSNGFQTMSQDTGNELNGRFTAIQEYTAAMAGDVAELKGLSLVSIDYLASIEKHTQELPEMNERLGKIEKHTSKL